MSQNKTDSRILSDNVGIKEEAEPDTGFDRFFYDFSSFIIFKGIMTR